jgi:hypothetical protein
MQAWGPLFSVTAESAATMLGLLFVAVSIHGAGGKMHPDSRILAEQAFSNYLLVLLTSALALFPSLTLRQLGILALGLTAARGVWAAIRMYRVAMRPLIEGSRWKSLRRHVLSLVGFAVLILAAARLTLNYGDPRAWFAAAVVALLLGATSMAWELLLRISASKS